MLRDISKLSEVFPKVDMVFGDKQKLSLSPENYLFKVITFKNALFMILRPPPPPPI